MKSKIMLAVLFLGLSTSVYAKTNEERQSGIDLARKLCVTPEADKVRACVQFVLNGEISEETLKSGISSSSMLSANTGSLESIIINQFADWLVDRGKAEFRILAVATVKKKLCTEELSRQSVFPATCELLSSLEGLHIPINGYEAILKDAAQTDLRSYAKKVVSEKICTEIVEKDECKAAVKDIRQTVAMVEWIRKQSVAGESPLALLEAIGNDSANFTDSTIYKKAVEIRNSWCQIKAVVYSKIPKNCFASPSPILPLTEIDEKHRRLIGKLVTIRISIEKEMIAAESASDEIDQNAKVLAARVESLSGLVELVADQLNSDTPGIDDQARASIQLLAAQLKGNASLAALSLRQLVMKSLDVATEARKATTALNAKLRESIKNAESYKVFPVVASFASLQSPEQAHALIDGLAAPLGSWRCKTTGDCPWSLTSFFGFQYSKENSDAGGDADAYGLFAPLGLHAVCSKYRAGIFVQALDISAVVSARKSESEAETNATFSQIFSPGIYGTYQFQNSPITLGFGVARIPKFIRTQTGDEDATQIRAFLAVDVTLWSF